MKKQNVKTTLSKAEQMCSHSGGRLTQKRKRILEILLQAKLPLSAYEVADKYNKTSEATMPPMSVYRILEYLQSESLVHKLSSANKYVACSHIACNHAHEVPQFLICAKCQKVKEIGISKSIIDELDKQVVNVGYTLINSQLELQCVCEDCGAKSS